MRLHHGFCLLVGILLCTALAWSAPVGTNPYIGYLYPAGGQQGTVVQITAAGQRLRGTNAIYVSGTGVHATVIGYVGANGLLNREQQDELQRRIRALIDTRTGGRTRQTPTKPESAPLDTAKPVTLPDLPDLRNIEQMTISQLRAVADKYLNRKKRPQPPIAEEVTVSITIDPDAAPGTRELRMQTPAGLTNPMLFQVGELPELCEKDRRALEAVVPPTASIPLVLNGQIMPGEKDRFTLQLHKGQQLAMAAHARELIPYLADAVPGWFQAILTLYDPAGKSVAFADDRGFDPDPILCYQVPNDGVYTLEVRDSIYRGREDFVYRVTVSEQEASRPLFPFKQLGGKTADPFLPIIDSSIPKYHETEPNNTGQQASMLTLPQFISGRIQQVGDVDLFRFQGRAGDEVVAEVYARRLGSPLDALLRVLDAQGRVIAWNDDREDPSMGLVTHHADAYLTVKLPETGVFFVQVSDVQRHGGDEYNYSLRISPPQPDFALRMTPSSITVPAGRNVPVTVHAFRKDGWTGEIEVALKNAPAGFTLSGAVIPAGRNSMRMTLTGPLQQQHEPVVLQLEGRAKIGDALVVRPVIPADEMMQAFAYQHLVPREQLMAAVTFGGRNVPKLTMSNSGRIHIPAGGQTTVAFTMKPLPRMPLQLELSDPPAGLALKNVQSTPTGMSFILEADDKHVGYADNLIVALFTEAEVKPPQGGEAKKQRVSLGVLPAIPFEIIPK